jgi:hypothetical protein
MFSMNFLLLIDTIEKIQTYLVVSYIFGLFLGVTGYTLYTCFGPSSKQLRDPFEEHENNFK